MKDGEISEVKNTQKKNERLAEYCLVNQNLKVIIEKNREKILLNKITNKKITLCLGLIRETNLFIIKYTFSI